MDEPALDMVGRWKEAMVTFALGRGTEAVLILLIFHQVTSAHGQAILDENTLPEPHYLTKSHHNPVPPVIDPTADPNPFPTPTAALSAFCFWKRNSLSDCLKVLQKFRHWL